MITALMIIAVLALVTVLVGMAYAAMNGCLVSQIWFMCGSAGTVLEIVGTLVVAIIANLNE